MWKLRLLNKVKIFLWKVFLGILPTVQKLCKRDVKYDSIYGRCKKEEKFVIHALVHYGYTKDVWAENFCWPQVYNYTGDNATNFLLLMALGLEKYGN